MTRTDFGFMTVGLVGAALAAIRFWPHRVADQASLPRTQSVYSRLKSDQRAAVLYQLPAQDQQVLVQTVEQFCVKKYERDSCIHHLITCGVPCMVVIPKPQRRVIFADYEKLRASRGLPPLPKVPHSDKEEE